MNRNSGACSLLPLLHYSSAFQRRLMLHRIMDDHPDPLSSPQTRTGLSGEAEPPSYDAHFPAEPSVAPATSSQFCNESSFLPLSTRQVMSRSDWCKSRIAGEEASIALHIRWRSSTPSARELYYIQRVYRVPPLTSLLLQTRLPLNRRRNPSPLPRSLLCRSRSSVPPVHGQYDGSTHRQWPTRLRLHCPSQPSRRNRPRQGREAPSLRRRTVGTRREDRQSSN